MRFSGILQSLRRFIPGGKFARSVAVLAGGTALGQTVTILASPLLTRLYDPQDFGIAAVYTSLLSIFSVVASLRYELAIPLPEEEPTAANVLWFSLLMVGLTACVAGLGVWFLGGKLVHLVNSPGLRPFLWLLPLGMALVGTYQVFSYWAIRREAFPRLARTKVTQGVSSVAVQLLFGFAYAGPLGLLLGRVVGQAAGVGTLALLARRRDAEALRAWSWQRMRYVALRYRRFPMLSSGAALVNALGLQVPVLLLSSLYGAQVVGHFSLVQRVLGIPLTLVGHSVSQVFLGRAATELRSDIHGLQKLFFAVAKRLALLAVVPAVVLAAAGPVLFRFVFGETWAEAGSYAQLMAIMFLASFVATPLSHTFNILERQDLSVAWNVGRLLLAAGAIYLTHLLGGSAMQAVATYSLAMLVGYGSLFLLSAQAIRRRVREQGGWVR